MPVPEEIQGAFVKLAFSRFGLEGIEFSAILFYERISHAFRVAFRFFRAQWESQFRA